MNNNYLQYNNIQTLLKQLNEVIATPSGYNYFISQELLSDDKDKTETDETSESTNKAKTEIADNLDIASNQNTSEITQSSSDDNSINVEESSTQSTNTAVIPKTNQYKYIDTDIDKNKLITNLKHNATKYVESKNWDDSRVNEFYDSLDIILKAIEDGHLSTNYRGNLVDNTGTLNNGISNWRDENNTVYTQEQYNTLSNREKRNLQQNFYPNRQVASYVNTIAEAVYKQSLNEPVDEPITEETSVEEQPIQFSESGSDLWDGFVKYLNPNKLIDLDAFLREEDQDSSGKYGTTYRAKVLGEYVSNYIEHLKNNLDFSNTPYRDRETYLALLTRLRNALSNGFSNEAALLLNRLGGNPNQYNAFFATEQTKEKSTNSDTNQQASSDSEASDNSEDTEESKNTDNSENNEESKNSNEESEGNEESENSNVSTDVKLGIKPSSVNKTQDYVRDDGTLIIKPHPKLNFSKESPEMQIKLNESLQKYTNIVPTKFKIYTTQQEQLSFNRNSRNLEQKIIDELNKRNFDITNIKSVKANNENIYLLSLLSTSNPGMFRKATSNNSFSTWVYLPESLDLNDMTVLAFDHEGKKASRVPMRNLLSAQQFIEFLKSLINN